MKEQITFGNGNPEKAEESKNQRKLSLHYSNKKVSSFYIDNFPREFSFGNQNTSQIDSTRNNNDKKDEINATKKNSLEFILDSPSKKKQSHITFNPNYVNTEDNKENINYSNSNGFQDKDNIFFSLNAGSVVENMGSIISREEDQLDLNKYKHIERLEKLDRSEQKEIDMKIKNEKEIELQKKKEKLFTGLDKLSSTIDYQIVVNNENEMKQQGIKYIT